MINYGLFLRLYIDLGFIGSIIYFATMLIIIPFKLFEKGEVEASFCWWISQNYLSLIYLTDNALIYMPCQLIVYTYTICKFKPVLLRQKVNRGGLKKLRKFSLRNKTIWINY